MSRKFMRSTFPGACGFAGGSDENGRFMLIEKHKTACRASLPRGTPVTYVFKSRAVVCVPCWDKKHPEDPWTDPVKRVAPPQGPVPTRAPVAKKEPKVKPCNCERLAMDAEVAHELLVAKLYGICAQKHGAEGGSMCRSCGHSYALTLGGTRAVAMQIRWACIKERHPLGWMATYREADAKPPMSAAEALELDEKLRQSAAKALKDELEAETREINKAAKEMAEREKAVEAKSSCTVAAPKTAEPETTEITSVQVS